MPRTGLFLQFTDAPAPPPVAQIGRFLTFGPRRGSQNHSELRRRAMRNSEKIHVILNARAFIQGRYKFMIQLKRGRNKSKARSTGDRNFLVERVAPRAIEGIFDISCRFRMLALLTALTTS